MKLDYLSVDSGYRYLSKVKHLFEHAFPPEERPPFSWFIKMDKNKLFGIEENNVFIGLLSIVEYQDLVYVFFLAVKKCFRGQGYGSQILKDVLNRYNNNRVFLLAEDPDIVSNNKEERIQRINFYEHNDMFKTDLRIVEYEVEYVALTNNTRVTRNDFLNVMKHLLDDFYPIYQSNVR